ncbi:MAG: serine/threonine protein kinase, partial [Kofleriaceae bacterium]
DREHARPPDRDRDGRVAARLDGDRLDDAAERDQPVRRIAQLDGRARVGVDRDLAEVDAVLADGAGPQDRLGGPVGDQAQHRGRGRLRPRRLDGGAHQHDVNGAVLAGSQPCKRRGGDDRSAARHDSKLSPRLTRPQPEAPRGRRGLAQLRGLDVTAALHSQAARQATGSSGEPSVDATGPRPLDPGLPSVFGRYLLIQRISRGGMGEIFLAKHGLAGFEKLCVIKKVLPSLAADEQFISRFIDEAGVAIKLQHVNVAQVFEVGRVGDEYFLALEYVEGRDLRRTLTLLQRAGRRMPVDLALFIAREMAQGLAYAHRRTSADGASLNLVHCDISPPNVVVSFEGETKIIDFGIAKSALRATATDPKMGFGKFGYMAPEQLVRGGQVDHRTDIYAVGVVLFELLTGQRLYEVGDNPDYRALARQVVKGEFRRLSEIDPGLAHLDELVVRALTPKAEDRYQTAAELRDAIQQALVSINPTISTDQLGAFMRDLFAT